MDKINRKAALLAVCFITLLCAGCGENEKKQQMAKLFEKGCETDISAELHLGEWGDKLVLKCEKVTPTH